MQSRSVIDQALGVVMGQRRCTADEAFGVLWSASQHRNIKLRDLCAELITNLSGRPPTAPELRPPPDRPTGSPVAARSRGRAAAPGHARAQVSGSRSRPDVRGPGPDRMIWAGPDVSADQLSAAANMPSS
ncbi:hypothetical protein M2271_003961 [Streptomyces sp. LBL]|nr:hypothetical protein [Streptomyces sp. LBL]